MQEASTKLLEVAGEMFAQKGFEATTVREICTRAEMNIAAVNYHFRDKESLYIEAVKYAHMCITSEIQAMDADEAEPEKQLERFITSMVGSLLDPDRPEWHAQLIMRELAHPTAACKVLVESYIRPLSMRLRQIIQKMLPEAGPDQVFLNSFSVVGQCLFFRTHRPIIRLLLEGQEFSAEKIAAHIARFTRNALLVDGEVRIRANHKQVQDEPAPVIEEQR